MPPPTADRLKIRCYRCNQLLAVAPNKAGTVVGCPKCKTELLIPRPGPQPTAGEPSDSSVISLRSDTFPSLAAVPGSSDAPLRGGDAPASAYLDEIAALIPPELAALRPEDLRVEADVFGAIVRQPAPTPPVADPFAFPGSFSGSGITASPAVNAPAPPAPAEPSPLPVAPIASPPTSAPVDAPPPLPIPTAPAPAAEASVVIPPIRLEPDPIRTAAIAETRTIREVVLPASVVLAWSLFVLAAIPMAFLAGLFIGHFLWKAGP